MGAPCDYVHTTDRHYCCERGHPPPGREIGTISHDVLQSGSTPGSTAELLEVPCSPTTVYCMMAAGLDLKVKTLCALLSSPDRGWGYHEQLPALETE